MITMHRKREISEAYDFNHGTNLFNFSFTSDYFFTTEYDRNTTTMMLGYLQKLSLRSYSNLRLPFPETVNHCTIETLVIVFSQSVCYSDAAMPSAVTRQRD